MKEEKKERNLHSRDPALAGLDGKESEHGREAIVIVEVLPVNWILICYVIQIK